MTILYYSWQENSTTDILETFRSLGHEVKLYVHELSHYFSAAFVAELSEELQTCHYDFIFTFNYISQISNTAEVYGIPYFSWIFDCPNIEIYSKSLSNSCNYIFLFDKDMCETAMRNHPKHLYHLPLAINTDRLNTFLRLPYQKEGFSPELYLHDISFVGSLYDRTMYNRLERAARPHLKGYLDGIMAAQKKIQGADLISGLLTEKRVAEIRRFLPIHVSADYTCTEKELYTHMIQKKITSEERIEAINLLSSLTPVALYTGSDAAAFCPDALSLGTVSYISQMPKVFHSSKINLNISLRSITSGIPLRAIDILACGGFLLSNYQPELCEFFVPGQDFVYYEDFTDLKEKAAYYLEHDTEREEIAYNGYLSAQKQFSYSRQVAKMLAVLE